MSLQVAHLSLALGGVQRLHDISLSVAPGRMLAVIGPNGAGKSTLIHAVIGDHPGHEGAVELAGRPIADMADRERACRVALLPQASALAFPFSVRDVVGLGRGPHASGTRMDTAIVAEACRAVDVAHLARRSYTRLSGGERQRVQLARVLAQIWRAEDAVPRLLLLDEPVAALDLGHQQQIMQRVRAFAAAGVAVVMVLHDITLAARHADDMLALRDGRVVAHGEPAKVVTPANMARLFDIDARVIAHPVSGTPVVLHG
ncbi:heme ABC transporter ATP-binding protein [Salinisphaera sp. T31B1]|uniref:heme ABC transporter ATP-binding protein n=1 Tax=Salinisphaera sp. T31B1 TaxID=727963 RepID=UPI003341769F